MALGLSQEQALAAAELRLMSDRRRVLSLVTIISQRVKAGLSRADVLQAEESRPGDANAILPQFAALFQESLNRLSAQKRTTPPVILGDTVGEVLDRSRDLVATSPARRMRRTKIAVAVVAAAGLAGMFVASRRNR